MKALQEGIIVIISPICVFSACIRMSPLDRDPFKGFLGDLFGEIQKMPKDSMLSLLLQELYRQNTGRIYPPPQDESYVNSVIAFAAPRNVHRRPYKVHM